MHVADLKKGDNQHVEIMHMQSIKIEIKKSKIACFKNYPTNCLFLELNKEALGTNESLFDNRQIY